MAEYDYTALYPDEFENLTRDLLQVEFGVYIESFKNGKDGGIDLRFSSSQGGKAIVQCKRYKEWNELKNVLGKEKDKVAKLNPQEYYLVTSVGLSPANKDDIKEIFEPYIKNTEHIIGKDDLNNLISKHTSIEKKYYKLWLASTVVLQEILDKDINNRTKDALETIRKEISTYVSNNSYQEALDIISRHHYVIISGIPGIGKTTLARMLIYNLLHEGYDELVALESNFRDFDEKYEKEKKQIFFYDDFLGSNYFEKGEKNFNNILIRIIEKVKDTTNTILIMTTREYILSDAKNYYECIDNKNYEIAKCILDLSTYTKKIRAKILYNHIASIRYKTSAPNTTDMLSDKCMQSLVQSKAYMKLINHPNFSPRIIENYIDNGGWNRYSEDEFVSKFIESFDNPTLVWEKAYEKLPKNENRHSLKVLLSMGKEVLLDDWQKAFRNYCKMTKSEYNLFSDDTEWNKGVKLLLDCFIKTNKVNGKHIVTLHNPAVYDFIINGIRKSEQIQSSLISGALYVDQLCTLFRDSASDASASIIVNEDLYEEVVDKFEELLDGKCKTCSLSKQKQLQSFNKIVYLRKFHLHFPDLLKKNPGLLEKYIKPEDFISTDTSFVDRTDFLPLIQWDRLESEANIEDTISQMKEQISSIDDYKDYLFMLMSLNMNYLIEEPAFLGDIEKFFLSEIDNISDDISDAINIKNVVDDILKASTSELLRNVLNKLKDRVYDKVSDYAEKDNTVDLPFMHNNINYHVFSRLHEDDKDIDDMMQSLVYVENKPNEIS